MNIACKMIILYKIVYYIPTDIINENRKYKIQNIAIIQFPSLDNYRCLAFDVITRGIHTFGKKKHFMWRRMTSDFPPRPVQYKICSSCDHLQWMNKETSEGEIKTAIF